jgi:predicted aspartyl protease
MSIGRQVDATGSKQLAALMRTFALVVVVVFIAIGIAPVHAAAGSSSCKLVRIAEWPVKVDGNQVVVQGAINGQPVGVQLDTGAVKSFIWRSAAARLRLARDSSKSYRSFGIGGESEADAAYVDELRIGEALNKDLRIAVVQGAMDRQDNIALLLGVDFLQNFEIEFDLLHNAVRLYQARDCDGVRLAYWGDAGELPMESNVRPVMTVKINGEPIRALLDSGASRSILADLDARRLGFTPETPGVVPGGCISGIGAKRMDTWIGQFRSFEVGNEMINDPKMYFADLWRDNRYARTGSHLPQRIAGLPDMLLGADFLRAHRVLVANSQRKVYFSYAGGPVFPTRQGKPCDQPGDKGGKD